VQASAWPVLTTLPKRALPCSRPFKAADALDGRVVKVRQKASIKASRGRNRMRGLDDCGRNRPINSVGILQVSNTYYHKHFAALYNP